MNNELSMMNFVLSIGAAFIVGYQSNYGYGIVALIFFFILSAIYERLTQIAKILKK